MQSLGSLIVENYRGHTAFNSDQPVFEYPEDSLRAFNQRYEMAHQFAATLDKASQEKLRYELQKLIATVFDVLLAQSVDQYETQFLSELKSECVRLLNEELNWIFRRQGFGIVDLTGKDTYENAVCLNTKRHYFGCLSQATTETLLNLGKSVLAKFRDNAAIGRLTREDLSVNSGPVVRAMCDVLTREFRATGVLDTISALTGSKHRLGLACELSVPQATWWMNTLDGLDRPPKTLYAHLDESISCPKAIVYLSDVTEKNGPTGCYPGAYEGMHLNPLQEIIGRVVGTVGTKLGSPLKNYYAKSYHQSINSEKFRRHFMRLPECLRFNSHLGWDIFPGSKLENTLSNSEVKMIGPAGTFIVFDGARLLHRGGLIQCGERIALQVIFFPVLDKSLIKRATRKIRGVFS